jgi:hypothetical protein
MGVCICKTNLHNSYNKANISIEGFYLNEDPNKLIILPEIITEILGHFHVSGMIHHFWVVSLLWLFYLCVVRERIQVPQKFLPFYKTYSVFVISRTFYTLRGLMQMFGRIHQLLVSRQINSQQLQMPMPQKPFVSMIDDVAEFVVYNQKLGSFQLRSLQLGWHW